MKKLLLSLLVLLCLAGGARATVITVVSQQIANVHYSGVSVTSPPHIRIYYSHDFTESTQTRRIVAGAPNGPSSSNSYIDIPCTIDSSGNVTIPLFTLDSTDDGIDYVSATISMYWYTSGNSYIGPVGSIVNVPVFHNINSVSTCTPAHTCATLQDFYIAAHGVPLPTAPLWTYSGPVIDLKLAAIQQAAGAPATERFIVQTPDAAIPNAQALNALTPGALMKTNAGGSGAVVAAVAGIDYQVAFTPSQPLAIAGGLLKLGGLTTIGAANQMTKVNAGATAWEYATMTGTSPVTVTPGVGSMTFACPTCEVTGNKDAIGGYPGLDGGGLLKLTEFPTVPFANGGTGLTTLGAAYTLLGVNSGATAYTPITIAAGSNITIGTSGSTISISASVVAGSAWSSLGNPTGNLALSNSTFTTAFTQGDVHTGPSWTWTMGAETTSPTIAEMLVQGTTGDTNLGYLWQVNTVGTGASNVVGFMAKGTSNGIKVDNTGTLEALGTGGVDAAALSTGNVPTARIAGSYTGITGLGTVTAGTWTATVIGATYGGLGANEGAASGALSINAGSVVNNAITTNGVPYGAAGNALSFTAVVNNAVFTTSNTGVPASVAPSANLAVSSGILDTAQGIQTTSTPRFAGVGLGVASLSFGLLDAGGTLNTQANGTVGSAELDALYNPTTNASAEYPTLLIKPTFNASGGSAGRTIDWIRLDSVDSGLTGLPNSSLFFVKATRNGGANLWTVDGAGNQVAVTYNKVVITAPATAATFAFSVDNATVTFQGTDTYVGRATTDTLTNKTLTSPVISSISNTGTITLPTSTDTLVGRATTDTLTNKTLASSTDILGGVTMTLGSDAEGDLYQRHSGVLSRIAIGSNGQFLQSNGTNAAWVNSSLTGTINASITGQLGYYATSGTAISGNSGLTLDTSNDLTIAPTIQSSGSPTLFKITGPAHTTLAASTEAVDVDLALNRTVQFATGSLTTQRAVVIRPPTYSFVGASTLTNAATLAVAGAPPTGGANATLTNYTGIWVQGPSTLGATLTVPNQSNVPFSSLLYTSGTYSDTGSGQIFGVGTSVENNAARAVVGLFGLGKANGATSSAWGGVVAGYSNNAAAISNGFEVDYGGLVGLTTGTSNGLIVVAYGNNAPRGNAITVQTGAAGSAPISGVTFNVLGGVQPATASLITTNASTSVPIGIDLSNLTASTAQFVGAKYVGGTAAGSTVTIAGTANAAPSSAFTVVNPLVVNQTAANTVFVGAGTGEIVGAAADVLHLRAPDAVGGALNLDSNGGLPSTFRTRVARGTFAAQTLLTAISNTVPYGKLTFNAFDGSAFADGGAVYGINQTNWSTADHSARVELVTVPTGTTGQVRSFIAGAVKSVTNNTLTSIVAILIPANTAGGMSVKVTIQCTNGTDTQVAVGEYFVGGVNKAGTVTGINTAAGFVTILDANNAAQKALTAGTLAITPAVFIGATFITFEITANSSLAGITRETVAYTATSMSDGDMQAQ